MIENPQTILALYPNTRGFGYMCVASPKILVQYGIVTSRPVSNQELLERVIKLIRTFKPTTIVLRNCNGSTSHLAFRSRDLVSDISAFAATQNIGVVSYTRKQIRDVFEVLGAKTKQETATMIAAEFPELVPHIPELRKPWKPESYQMGIFDSMALVITHKYLTE